MSRQRPMRFIALFLCASLLFPAVPLHAWWNYPPVVTFSVGQPSVWSLGQAHYLLAQMHQLNRGLSTHMPSQAELDPNRPNASRLEVVRTLLGIEAQFDQGIGIQNRIAQQTFRDSVAKRDNARVALEQRRAERQRVNQEVGVLDEQIAKLQVEDSLADQKRGTKVAPSAADVQRKQTIAVLTARRDQLKGDRDQLDAEITSLNTDANATPAAPTLATSPVSSTAGTLPTSSTLTKFMDKFADDASTPSLAASTALDNFVDMQYEIISKQLTLLRDEVGPDQRVIFLELPTAIYTVDKSADGYVAQVEWAVTGVYDEEPSVCTKRDVIEKTLSREGKSDFEIDDTLLRIKGLEHVAKVCPPSKRKISAEPSTKEDESVAGICANLRPIKELQGSERASKAGRIATWPVTLEMITSAKKQQEIAPKPVQETPLTAAKQKKILPKPGQETPLTVNDGLPRVAVRALDVIPHQSALNVNEDHATVNNFSILGVLKLVSGFGAKLDYQRQKELYEKYLQQKAFASGFGKGSNRFGWTFGPLPGSKRIEPGQRTTYAALAVPRNTLALEVTATVRAFKRDQPATLAKDVQAANFLILVPGEATERFWVDGLDYTPASKGKRVAVVVHGNFFSPQLGVLVNGAPLKRALSITRIGGDEPAVAAPAQGMDGEYEITNSRELVLSFSMGTDFIGTPMVTLVTPERSNDINYLPLLINHRENRISLRDLSEREPMFIEAFSLDSKLEALKAGAGPFVKARLSGTGLRSGAEVAINDTALKACQLEQESTHSYVVYFKSGEAPKEEKGLTVRYRQKTTQGFEEKEFKKPGAALATTLRHYRPGNPAEVDLSFMVPEKNADVTVFLDDPSGRTGGCKTPKKDEDGSFRVKCLVPPISGGRAKRIDRDFMTVRIQTRVSGGPPNPPDRYVDIPLPVRPRVASIENLTTRQPSGFADEDATAVIRGVNLLHVTAVLFGDQEAKIVNAGDIDGIVVKVPTAEVPKGERSTVLVLVRSDAGISAVGTYTYVGEPLPAP
jgi:hypothetical protein